MTWEVTIDGSETNLVMLAEGLIGGDSQLFERDGEYILRSSSFEVTDSAQEVRDLAQEILNQLTACAILALGSHVPLRVKQVSRLKADGSRNYFLIAETGRLHIRGFAPTISIRRADGSEEIHRPTDPIRSWMVKGRTSPQIAKALRLRAEKIDLSWVALYRLLEAVEVPLPMIVANGWATRTALRLFKHTADSMGAIGDEARHGRETTKPPPKPMTLTDAQKLIDRILLCWLNS